MHLNGVGTVRDCSIATSLLKRVSERGAWVSSRLQDAYSYAQTVDYDAASDSDNTGGTGGFSSVEAGAQDGSTRGINSIMKFLNWISFGLIPDSTYQNTAEMVNMEARY